MDGNKKWSIWKSGDGNFTLVQGDNHPKFEDGTVQDITNCMVRQFEEEDIEMANLKFKDFILLSLS